MKLNLTVSAIVIFFQITIAFGQNFAPIGAQWHYSSSAGGFAPTESEYQQLISEKDTTINNLSLRKIRRLYYRYTGGLVELDPLYLYELNDTVSMYDQKTNQLHKLYVYNAKTGDTLALNNPDDHSTYRVVIDSIAENSYDGTMLKTYYIDRIDGFGWSPGYYVEKIGGTIWYLPMGTVTIPEADGPLRCYSDSSIDVKLTSKDCDFNLKSYINELTDEKFEIFPNPTTDFLYVKTKEKINNIEVIDNTGKIVVQTISTEINLGFLAKGIYTIRISSQNQTYIGKIVKE